MGAITLPLRVLDQILMPRVIAHDDGLLSNVAAGMQLLGKRGLVERGSSARARELIMSLLDYFIIIRGRIQVEIHLVFLLFRALFASAAVFYSAV